MVDALKPCPFCGGEAEIERRGDRRQSTIYSCTECSCSLETGEEWDYGRDWNRRSTLSDAVAEREAEPVASVAEVRADGQRLYNTVYPSDALDKFPIGTPLYTSPPTSELEALRKRVAELEKERDVAAAAMVRNHQRAEAAEARVAALEAQLAERVKVNQDILDDDFRAIGFTGAARQYPRDNLSVLMFAAFNGVTPDKLPSPAWRYFPNESTKAAWERVASAVIAAIEATPPAPKVTDADMDDAAVAALVALARHNIPTDIQELLVRGDPMRSIPPGALSKSFAAALKTLTAAQEAGKP